MKGIFGLAVVTLLGAAAVAGAAGVCLMNNGVHCINPPPPDCPDCSCPCERGHHHCGPWKSQHAHQLIEELGRECCCDRIRAARKLGCRIHADFCCTPEVLDALLHALMCDPCWEVRRAAAWSITMQRARVEQAVLALYVSSKTDPHYLVRDKAAESLDILILCRTECYRDLLKNADSLIKELKKNQFKPGSADCQLVYQHGCSACALLGNAAPKATVIYEQIPSAPAAQRAMPMPSAAPMGKPTK